MTSIKYHRKFFGQLPYLDIIDSAVSGKRAVNGAFALCECIRCVLGMLQISFLMIFGLVVVLRVSILIGDWIGYGLYSVCMIIYIMIMLMVVIHKVVKLLLLNEHSFNQYRFRNY